MWSPINCCIKEGYYSGNFSLSPTRVFVFLLIARWKPWALVTEDKLTWEWLSHQSLALRAVHLSLWASRPKFCPQSEVFFLKKERERKRQRRRKTSGWRHISLVSIVWPAVFSQCALGKRSPPFAPFRCASTSSHGSKLHTFITFAARVYCERAKSLKKCADGAQIIHKTGG